MSRIKKRETKVERSRASKRVKMNARATSWVTHGDGTYFARATQILSHATTARLTGDKLCAMTSLWNKG